MDQARHAGRMIALFTHSLLAATLPLAAAAHRGGRAMVWIVGWLVILAALAGVVVWIVRSRRRPPEQGGR
jgi:hypothetical protein